jgi:hypothetical protein
MPVRIDIRYNRIINRRQRSPVLQHDSDLHEGDPPIRYVANLCHVLKLMNLVIDY